MKKERLALCGGMVLLENGCWSNSTVIVESGRISELSAADKRLSRGVTAVDCRGKYVCPGLIDTHVHGAMGHNYMEATEEAFSAISDFLIRSGVTACLATTTSAELSDELAALKAICRASEKPRMGEAEILGAHLEGPFVSVKNRGSHKKENIREITHDELEAIVSAAGGKLRVVTLAPEKEYACDAISFFTKKGVSVSVGHTEASCEITRQALRCGANRVTHLYSAMPPMHHRMPGPVPPLLLDDNVFVELTADGIHSTPEMLALAVRAAGTDRIVLITDGVDVRGLGDGSYRRWEGTEVVVSDGAAHTLTGSLAGSMLQLSKAVKNLVEFTGVSFAEAVAMATKNPARSVGVFDRKGSIAVGKDADFAIFDENMNLSMTIVRGRVINI